MTERFNSHLIAAFLSPERSTISNLICIGGRAELDWTADYRMYSKGRVNVDSLLDGALEQITADLPPEHPAVFGVDDTICRKSGTHIPGVAWRRDPLGPAFHTNLVKAQRFLMFSGAYPIGDGSAQMIPVMFDHAPTVSKLPSKATDEEKVLWKIEQNAHKLSTRALCGMKEIVSKLGDRKVIFVGDGGYTNGEIVQNLPDASSYIGRTRKDAKLYYPPSPEEYHGNGRQKIYGDRAPTPHELYSNSDISWEEVTGYATGRKHQFRIKVKDDLLWRPAGGEVRLRLVVRACPKKGDFLYIFSVNDFRVRHQPGFCRMRAEEVRFRAKKY